MKNRAVIAIKSSTLDFHIILPCKWTDNMSSSPLSNQRYLNMYSPFGKSWYGSNVSQETFNTAMCSDGPRQKSMTPPNWIRWWIEPAMMGTNCDIEVFNRIWQNFKFSRWTIWSNLPSRFRSYNTSILPSIIVLVRSNSSEYTVDRLKVLILQYSTFDIFPDDPHLIARRRSFCLCLHSKVVKFNTNAIRRHRVTKFAVCFIFSQTSDDTSLVCDLKYNTCFLFVSVCFYFRAFFLICGRTHIIVVHCHAQQSSKFSRIFGSLLFYVVDIVHITYLYYLNNVSMQLNEENFFVFQIEPSIVELIFS